MGRTATDVTLAIVFALVSLAAVDITAEDTSDLSDTHECSLGHGGSSDESAISLSFTGGVARSN